MASTLSKRHQARNEKALQELIKTVPGNDRCADCQARNPGWASWSLGIFLCMRCAALHRKLGTHISKVKSLSMDSWSNDQVDVMRRTGNTAANAVFNPKNTRPPIPLDVDEVDTAMEKFIRQKYDQQAYKGGASQIPPVRVPVRFENYEETGLGRRSSEDQPPPPPPKTGRLFKFGLRSASSALPASRGAREFEGNPEVPRKALGPPSPIKINKQSRVFGASIGLTEEGMEWKLVTLKEMGFPDDKRNSNVLKGLNGDLERAIESLVRLGEGTPGSRGRTPISPRFPDGIRSGTGTPKTSFEPSQPTARVPSQAMGLQIQRPATSDVQPQKQASVPSYNPSYNPFETSNPTSAPLQAPSDMDQAFQNMHITQPLFPNATGGYPTQQQQMQQARLQQSMTPPVPQVPQHFVQTNPFALQTNGNSISQGLDGNFNPFMNALQHESPISNNPYPPSIQPFTTTNPFNQIHSNGFFQHQNQIQYQQHQMTPPQSLHEQQQQQRQNQLQYQQNQMLQNQHQEQQQPQQQYQQHQQQYLQYQQPSQQQPQEHPGFQGAPQQNFNTQTHSQFSQPSPFANHQTQYVQPLSSQMTGRVDKSSILALYNYPQLAPAPQTQQINSSGVADGLTSFPQPPTAKLPPGVPGQVHRSATMPVSLSGGSKNPFSLPRPSPTMELPQTNVARHGSQESADLQSGRHSPDAFASLSARFVR